MIHVRKLSEGNSETNHSATVTLVPDSLTSLGCFETRAALYVSGRYDEVSPNIFLEELRKDWQLPVYLK